MEINELSLKQNLGLIGQMRGAGSFRKKNWPLNEYAFCAAKNFDVDKDGNFGVQCAYSGVWGKPAEYIDLNLPAEGLKAEITLHLDHIDPLSYTWDNTFLNLTLLCDFFNGSHFKHDKIAPYTIYHRARLGMKNEWPYLARLIQETFDYENFPLTGWPVQLSEPDGRPIYPGYDLKHQTFKPISYAVIAEYEFYLPRVRAFVNKAGKNTSDMVARKWGEYFGRELPL